MRHALSVDVLEVSRQRETMMGCGLVEVRKARFGPEAEARDQLVGVIVQ